MRRKEQTITLNLSAGWCRTKPVHRLREMSGYIQCSTLQNYISRWGKTYKVGGTTRYNQAALTDNTPWVKRSYHKRADGTFVRRTFCFINGVIYYGDDTAGTLTSAQAGFSTTAVPTDATMQVSGNSILYFFTGEDTPYKYDGNGSYSWEKSTLSSDYESATPFLDRMFYVKKKSAQIDYSEALSPETNDGTFTVGNDKDSYNQRIVIGSDESLYVFKNNSIYRLFGRTKATFSLRLVTDKYGLACKRAIYPVGGGFVFLNENDKELYFFGGSESSITPMTEEDIKLREIINPTPDAIAHTTMTVHDGLFRFAFQHKESDIDNNNCELVYPLNEPLPNGYPRWSLIKGSNVLSYSVWNKHGDDNELVTGRSDFGLLMYNNRTRDFDDQPIETDIRTGELVVSEDMEALFTSFFIRAKPGSYNVKPDFRYYLNGRYSAGGSQTFSMAGETRDIGQVHLSKQSIFNDRIIPYISFRRGNSISFRIYDNHNDTDLELYSIAVNIIGVRKIQNQYVGQE